MFPQLEDVPSLKLVSQKPGNHPLLFPFLRLPLYFLPL